MSTPDQQPPSFRKTALVTGATSGIGREVARQLRQRGVEVFATGRNPKALAELSAECGCHTMVADLAEQGAVDRLYAQACVALAGAPTFVVNNAGYNSRKATFVDVSADELELQWRVNLRAPARLCQLALKDMGELGQGHIVNVVSTVVHLGIETMGAYSMMKAGLLGLTRVLIKEARAQGVKVTAVHPGGTDSGFRAVERPDYMRPSSAAEMILGVLFAPDDVVVHELTFRPLVETNF